MIGLKDYQSIKTPEDYEYDDLVNSCFEELCEMYADEIAERGMSSANRAGLMARARKMAKDRLAEVENEDD